MSEILIKNNAYESSNAVITRGIREVIKAHALDAAPYYREIVLKKESPIKNVDDKLKYVRIDAPEDVEIIFDGRSHHASYFEIMVSQPKNLSIKYHGETQVMIALVGGA